MSSAGVRAVAVMAAVAALAFGPAPRPHARGPVVNRPDTCGGWEVMDSPNVGANANDLSGVSAASPTDVWAVGSTFTGSVFKTLAVHDDGSGWTVVSSPNVGSRTNALSAVAAVSDGEAWAVGHYDDGTTFRTLIERWDGASWKVVASPNSGTGENVLRSVAVAGPADVWAVGYREPAPGSPRQTLALHWDGASWQVAATPNAGTGDNYLWSVAARPGGEAWAVGAYSVPWFQTLTERWDGSHWSVVDSPSFGDGNNSLYAVTVLPRGRALAVGSRLQGFGDRTLAERWGGSRWRGQRTPSPAGYLNELLGVAALGGHGLWAVGYTVASVAAPSRTLALRWDGTSWTQEPTPDPGADDDILAAVAGVPQTGELWAVGHQTGAQQRTLIEHRC